MRYRRQVRKVDVVDVDVRQRPVRRRDDPDRRQLLLLLQLGLAMLPPDGRPQQELQLHAVGRRTFPFGHFKSVFFSRKRESKLVGHKIRSLFAILCNFLQFFAIFCTCSNTDCNSLSDDSCSNKLLLQLSLVEE